MSNPLRSLAGRLDHVCEIRRWSASESLAHNLAAKATKGEQTVHSGTMEQPGCSVKATPHKRLISPRNRGGWSWPARSGGFPFFRHIMRIIPIFPAAMFLAGTAFLAGAPAHADSHVFIVANHADGYGIDQCLALGERCGAHAAHSYCRSRDFVQATAYRRVKPDEMTDSISGSTGSCRHSGCNEFVAITCQR